MRSVPAIAFDYRPSRRLAMAIAAAALLALIAISLCGLNDGIKSGLALSAISYAAYSLRRFLRPPFAHVLWHSAGHWRLRDADGRDQSAELAHAVILGTSIVLLLRTGRKRRLSLFLLPDNCGEETARRLRVRLMRADSVGTEEG